jgi:hypothetical protein
MSDPTRIDNLLGIYDNEIYTSHYANTKHIVYGIRIINRKICKITSVFIHEY